MKRFMMSRNTKKSCGNLEFEGNHSFSFLSYCLLIDNYIGCLLQQMVALSDGYFTEVLRSIRKVIPDTTMERPKQHSTHW